MSTFTLPDLREVTTEELAKDLIQLASNSLNNKGFKSAYVPSRTRWGPCTKLTAVVIFDTQEMIDHIQNLVDKEIPARLNKNIKRNLYLDALHKINKRTTDAE